MLNNRALRSRLSLVGQLTDTKVRAYALSGIPARGAGVLVDQRLQARWGVAAYSLLSCRAFLGRRGDNLDRFLLRIKEVVETFRLLAQLQALLTATRGSAKLTHPVLNLGGFFHGSRNLRFRCLRGGIYTAVNGSPALNLG